MGEKRNHEFKRNSRGNIESEVNYHGQTGWQGNNFSSNVACRGSQELEINKIEKVPPSLLFLTSLEYWEGKER